VTVVVRKLEERSLITRRRNPKDRRCLMVSLTAEGKHLRQIAEPAVAEVQEEMLAPLCESDHKTLCRLLQRLADENNHLSRVPVRQTD